MSELIDMPENVERELERLHALLLEGDIRVTPDRKQWAQEMIDIILRCYFVPPPLIQEVTHGRR